jgi:hypothetical protein
VVNVAQPIARAVFGDIPGALSSLQLSEWSDADARRTTSGFKLPEKIMSETTVSLNASGACLFDAQ